MTIKAKQILLILGGALLLAQLYRPPKNLSNDRSHHVALQYPTPDSVTHLLKVACDDCHSNLTRYPWYAEVQPLASWLGSHINGGKHHLNFSEFTALRPAVQNHKFEEIIATMRDKTMPIPSYTYLGLHPEARLTDAQRQVLARWAEAGMDSLAAWYPVDSLILKRG